MFSNSAPRHFLRDVNAIVLFSAVTVSLVYCTSPGAYQGVASDKKGISSALWGVAGGKPVNMYTLRNGSGTTVNISNYGGTIVSWKVKDKKDSLVDVVLG
ncbi:MAG TPA: hypothetical protein VKR32_03395, partial [Puia sp.]|nr:hypothetical protein [Puia sp.]